MPITHANPPPTPPMVEDRDYGPAPPRLPLLFMHDPFQHDRLVGLDWNGNPRATAKPSNTNVGQAPDGSMFQMTYGGGFWNGGQFFDAAGGPLQVGALPGGLTGVYDTWADDSRHICVTALDLSSGWHLLTTGPGEAARDLGAVVVDSRVPVAVTAAACSWQNDRAVVIRTLYGGAVSGASAPQVSDVWVVRLSTGATLAHHAYAVNAAADVVVSSDAKYVAENSQAEYGSKPERPATARVRRVADWSSLKTVVGRVVLFSGDDSLAVVVPPTESGSPHSITVIDWHSDATRWHQTSSETYQRFFAQPGGRDFALARGNVSVIACAVASWACSFPISILIVRGDGMAITLPNQYVPVW